MENIILYYPSVSNVNTRVLKRVKQEFRSEEIGQQKQGLE